MTYRYEPKSQDSEKLAELFGSRMPHIALQFQVDQRSGMLRVRGDAGKGRNYRSYEQLLRNEHEPEFVVTTFEDKLKCRLQPTR